MGITYHYMSITRIQPVRRKIHNPIRRTIEEGQIIVCFKSLFLGKIIPNIRCLGREKQVNQNQRAKGT